MLSMLLITAAFPAPSGIDAAISNVSYQSRDHIFEQSDNMLRIVRFNRTI